MNEAAPKDGTVVRQPRADADARQHGQHDRPRSTSANSHYLGRLVTNIDTGAALPKSGIRSFEDVRKKRIVVGASGGGSTTVLFPSALIAYAGAKMKIVRGYKGHDRHHPRAGARRGRHRRRLWVARHAREPARWVHKKEANILYAWDRSSGIGCWSYVPTLPELALNGRRPGSCATRRLLHRRLRPLPSDHAGRPPGTTGGRCAMHFQRC